MPDKALGLIETHGLVGAIEATDAAVKAAEVTIASRESLGSGYVTVAVQGELGDVQAAVEAATQAAQRVGQFVASKVIPRPASDVTALLRGHVPPERPARIKRAPERAEPPAAAAPPTPKKEETPAPEPMVTAPPRVSDNGPDLPEIEEMPVVKLRQFARTVDGLPIQGREISMANKQELLEAIRSVIS